MEYNRIHVYILFQIYCRRKGKRKIKTIVMKAKIPCKLVQFWFQMLDGGLLLSVQDCMSASVNRLLTMIMFCWLFFLFICYCSFNPCAAACVPY